MPTTQSTPWWSESSARPCRARAEINDASVPARTPHSMTASLRRALDTRVLVASLFLLALAIFVGIFVPAFYRESNAFILLRQTAMLGIVALGETLVLIVGGIDLSVTSVIGLAVVIIGQMSPYGTVGALLSIPMVVAFGMSVGAVNGTLVTLRKMPPFIATLAMNTALFGAILAYTGGLPSGEIPSVLLPIGLDGIGPLPYSFLLWCFLAVSLAVVLRYTVFGRQIYATGLNREAVAPRRTSRQTHCLSSVRHLRRTGGCCRHCSERMDRLRGPNPWYWLRPQLDRSGNRRGRDLCRRTWKHARCCGRRLLHEHPRQRDDPLRRELGSPVDSGGCRDPRRRRYAHVGEKGGPVRGLVAAMAKQAREVMEVADKAIGSEQVYAFLTTFRLR